jgi:aminoglycoside phosphotransferase
MTEEAAAQRAGRILRGLGRSIARLTRMPVGLCHHVFEAELAGGGSVVLRLGRPETAAAVRGGVAWHGRLAAAGVPVPALLAFSLEGDHPYMLLERLPGRDLLFEYPSMTDSELRALACELAAVQARAATLASAHGYGHARDYGDPALAASWEEVVARALARSRTRLESSGACAVSVVDAVARRLPAFHAQWERIEPVAFLDDTTTKNVIVDRGRLSGIVDTDYVCFGDPLYTLGLTRMALLASGLGTAYADHWADCLALDSAARARVGLYTAVFCVDFLSELGRRFNRDEAAEVDPARKALLLGILDAELARVDEGAGAPR